jgi:hypothetical protein
LTFLHYFPYFFFLPNPKRVPPTIEAFKGVRGGLTLTLEQSDPTLVKSGRRPVFVLARETSRCPYCAFGFHCKFTGMRSCKSCHSCQIMSFMSNLVIHVKSCHSCQIMSFMSNQVIYVIHVNSCHSCQIMSFMSNHVIHVKSCQVKSCQEVHFVVKKLI